MRRFNPNPKTAARYEGTVRRKMVPGAMMCPQWTGRVNPQWQDLDKIGRARKPQVYTFWNDLFHPGVEEEFVTSIMLRILARPQHFYIICTKRPERALEYFNLCWPDYVREFGPNPFKSRLMLMTTAENQAMADLRLPVLLQIPGVLHSVSAEPGLGMVDFCRPFAKYLRELDWVICGGETGPHARPMHPDIPRQLRDQCQAAGAPFFFKAWGEWTPVRKKLLWVYNDGRTVEFTREAILAEERRSGLENNKFNPALMSRVGKKAAGRTLDGRTWDEVPEVLAS
jgi:protein gp37